MTQNEIHYTLGLPGQRRSTQPKGPPDGKPLSGQLPRITRLMALAIKFDDLLGEVEGLSYAELARLGGVSRSHITHILNLLHLAPTCKNCCCFWNPAQEGLIAFMRRAFGDSANSMTGRNSGVRLKLFSQLPERLPRRLRRRPERPMSEPELLDGAQWRGFRLFMVELEERALEHIYFHLKREMTARRERENDITRLLFRSLESSDLETAQQTILEERRARAKDRRTLAHMEALKKTTSRASR
jgi:hypothetical protein